MASILKVRHSICFQDENERPNSFMKVMFVVTFAINSTLKVAAFQDTFRIAARRHKRC